jgi:hypothetical protein
MIALLQRDRELDAIRDGLAAARWRGEMLAGCGPAEDREDVLLATAARRPAMRAIAC